MTRISIAPEVLANLEAAVMAREAKIQRLESIVEDRGQYHVMMMKQLHSLHMQGSEHYRGQARDRLKSLLTGREHRCIVARYNLGKNRKVKEVPFRVVAKQLGVCAISARAIEASAIRKLVQFVHNEFGRIRP